MTVDQLLLDWRTAPKRAIREGIAEGLSRIGGDERVVVLSGDLADSTRVREFGEWYPKRFWEMGVQEQNIMGVAAGAASEGLVPFVSSYAVFSPGRNWEQIRTSIALSRLNVKILGGHGGVVTGKNGPTHQATEDIALMRVLPGMVVLVPADATQMVAAIEAAYGYRGPVYIRAARPESFQLTNPERKFEIGKIEVMREGKGVTVAASGVMVGEVMLAADLLEGEGIEVEVLNICSVKPLDIKGLVASVKKTGRIVTVEDHQVQGGMGSAIAEALGEYFPVPVKRIGILDRFGESGSWEEVREELGLGKKAIMRAVLAMLNL